MFRTRFLLLLATALGICGAVPAIAQDIEKMEWFAPPDISFFGSRPRANEGFFLTFEGLAWHLNGPGKTTVGKEGATRLVYLSETVTAVETNSMTNGFVDGGFEGGYRFDIGNQGRHHGLHFSFFDLLRERDYFVAPGVSVVFHDPPFGGSPPRYHLQGPINAALTNIQNLPVRFTQLELQNRLDAWGLELNYVYRMHPNRFGGFLEFMGGVRYIEFDDEFAAVGTGGTLDESRWTSMAENHLVGPQVGGRWFRKFGRWTWSAESKFIFGFNQQNLRLEGFLGSNLDPTTLVQYQISNMGPTTFVYREHEDEFSPAVELRIAFSYQVTSAISARVGWTGMWIDNIARASRIIDYSVPNMGIDLSRNSADYAFMNGVTFGIDLNR